MLNASHVVDLAELGADDSSGADVLYEAKVPSPLTASHCAGRGSDANGGNAASVGHLYGFGNTEESYRVLILGCKQRGRRGMKAMDHATGIGWVQPVSGQYADALRRGQTVVCAIVESTGGVTPSFRAHVARLTRRSTGKQATDRTRYGLARVSTKSFYVHHMQRMSTAAVMYDARAIRHQVTCKKQKALQVAQAAVAGGA